MWDIITTIEEDNNLIVEAGVGIGKSFAYLIPGILYSKYSGKPLIVATSSIGLQDQVAKDIETASEILAPYLNNNKIDIVIGKGRTNYPCPYDIASLNVNETKKEKLLELIKNNKERQDSYDIDDSK